MKKTELLEMARRLAHCDDITSKQTAELYKIEKEHKPKTVARSFGSYGANALIAQSTTDPARFFLVTARGNAFYILDN